MSLYNMLFGVNPFADMLLQMIGTDRNKIPRFRDCILKDSGEGFRFHKQIVIHTRTGGPLRPEFEAENQALRRIPGYIKDVDNGFDPTYADFFYHVPIPAQSMINMISKMGAVSDTDERWQNVVNDLNSGKLNSSSALAAASIGDRIAELLGYEKKPDK